MQPEYGTYGTERESTFSTKL